MELPEERGCLGGLIEFLLGPAFIVVVALLLLL